MIRLRRACGGLALLAVVGLADARPAASREYANRAAPAVLSGGGVASGRATVSRIGVELVPPDGNDTLSSVTPTFTIHSVGIEPAARPIVLGLQVSYNPGFTLPLLVDTTVTRDTVAITLQRPLPARAQIYIRATARAASGEVAVSPSIARVVPEWLTLRSPNDPNGSTLETSRPRFSWRSAGIDPTVGPWVYDLEIRNVGSGQSMFYANLRDTTFTPTAALNLNTSYRWSVTARVRTGESVTVQSQSSFVIINPAVPLVTLLYQNFPNPFPTPTSNSTCVWFDLDRPSRVALDVFDLSGRHVRNIIPGPTGPVNFIAGRHGRVAGGPVAAGCNGEFQWDGRGDDGDFVSAGVYLLRLRAAGVESVKKIVFRGRP